MNARYKQLIAMRDQMLGISQMGAERTPAPENQETLMQQAAEYADKQISDRAGWTSTDKTDFAQFGGDRAKAREYYMRQYIQMANGEHQTPAANPLDVLEEQFGKR